MGQQHITKRLDNNENLRGQICKIDFDEIMKLYKGTKKNTPILEKYFEGIGYVENMGAAIKSPVNLVKIAINKIILAAENNTSRLNIMPRRLTEVSYP